MKDTFNEKYHYYSPISKEYFPTSVCSYQKDLILARNFTIVSTGLLLFVRLVRLMTDNIAVAAVETI